ncbi:MAG TPA: hypothetical protein VK453_27325 [Micromonosporaceae bacterium]|nr:hypothetical protein [Micromonosporaceae bacterium]
MKHWHGAAPDSGAQFFFRWLLLGQDDGLSPPLAAAVAPRGAAA